MQLMPKLKYWRMKNLILEKRFYSMTRHNCGAVTYCDDVMSYQSSDWEEQLNIFLRHFWVEPILYLLSTLNNIVWCEISREKFLKTECLECALSALKMKLWNKNSRNTMKVVTPLIINKQTKGQRSLTWVQCANVVFSAIKAKSLESK